MRIRFGMNWDGPVWPEWSEGERASIGEVFVGPLGLVSLLETHLGLGCVEVPEALRIRRYMEAIDALQASDAFYSASFAADAWATARELLAMRDDLVLHGWNGAGESAPPRIAVLAHVEAAAITEPGLADRLREVLRRLGARPGLPIRELVLSDPEDLMPLPWQALVRALVECGVEVSNASPKVVEPEKIVVLESDRPWLMAQGVVCWLRGAASDADIALLCSGDATLLDQALHHQARPATGRTESSAQLGVFQLLPLVLENIWKPVRIARLMELLSVPYSPVPRHVARRLIHALSKEPGLEGAKWRDALEKVTEDKAGYLARDGVGEAEAHEQGRALAREMDQWLRLSRVDESSPAPAELVAGAIQRLMKHLGLLAAEIPEARVAMGHCRDMLRILSTMREIDRALLENIVDDVIGPARTSMTRREAAPWGVISHPSQLAGPVDTLVWWNFHDDTAPGRHVWSEQERQWLADHGVALDSAERERALERAHWLSALGRARRMLLCRPLQMEGEPVAVHPLWFEINASEKLRGRVETIRAVELFTGDVSSLLGRALGLKHAGKRQVSTPTAVREVARSNFRPDKLSPTDLGNLFGCRFKWLVESLGIESSDAMSFPEDGAMVGTLAHQVLEDVFKPQPAPSEAEAKSRAAASFDKRLPEMAAELMAPEKLADRNDIRDRVISAAADLARLFSDAGFERFDCERWIETKLDGIPVKGRADVIAYKEGDEAAIIDFKYSSSSFYRKKIEEGTDVQLITYARMLGKRQTPVGYYLVPKREMVTVFPDFGVPTVETQVSVADGWNRVRKTYATAIEAIREGKVLAAGLLDEEELKALASECRERGEIFLDPPCRFCELGGLCGLNAGGDTDE